MKKKRLLCFLVLIVLLFSFLFSGCFDTNAAKNSAEIYCSLIFKPDAENIQKSGLSDSDKDTLSKLLDDKIKSELKNNLLLMEYSPSDEQLNSASDAYKEALSKITYDTKQISKSGDEAELEISTTSFDAKKIDEQAAMDALDETNKMQFASTDEENNKFGEIYLNKLTEGLKNAEVSSEKASITIKFKKVDKQWKPDDPTNFGYKLSQLATNKDNANLNIDDESISPEESAEIFWNLVIKEDSSGMEKLGYSKAFGEKLIRTMNENDFTASKKKLSQMDVPFSDDQIHGIIDALRGSLSKTSAKFEQVSKTDNTAQVKVSSTSINWNAAMKQAENNIKNQIISNRITDKQKIIDLCTTNLIDSINNAQVNSTNNENTFSFTKVGSIWVPSNAKSYFQSISDMSLK